jgi:hypothetical protein
MKLFWEEMAFLGRELRMRKFCGSRCFSVWSWKAVEGEKAGGRGGAGLVTGAFKQEKRLT